MLPVHESVSRVVRYLHPNNWHDWTRWGKLIPIYIMCLYTPVRIPRLHRYYMFVGVFVGLSIMDTKAVHKVGDGVKVKVVGASTHHIGDGVHSIGSSIVKVGAMGFALGIAALGITAARYLPFLGDSCLSLTVLSEVNIREIITFKSVKGKIILQQELPSGSSWFISPLSYAHSVHAS